MDIPTAIVRFCRTLRDRGLPVSPSESIDAARAVLLVDMADRTDLRLALRPLLTSRPADLELFDAAFDEMWPEHGWRSSAVAPTSQPTRRGRPAPPSPQTPHAAAATLSRWARATEGMAEDSTTLRLAASTDTRQPPSFATFGVESLNDAERVARRIARRLAVRPSRRWRPTSRGPRLHLRQTVRSALRTAGDLSLLVYRQRALRRTKLVVLCDVSGSMDLYVRLLLQFLFALQHSFARVETFAFATRLSRLTTDLRARDYQEALRAVAQHVDDWNGGTRIGASLSAFVTDWIRLVDRRTIVVVLSDGWDTDEPAQLSDALATIRRRAGRLIWLNPLLGDPSYEPLTRGMQAALPHIDVFAPAHNLESLEALARHLKL